MNSSQTPRPAYIVDSHQHVFWHGRDDAGLVKDMDEQSIKYAWLLTWEMAPSEFAPKFSKALNPIHVRSDGTSRGIPLEDLLLAKQRYPERFVLGFCPNPLLDNAACRLRSAITMFDLKVCGEWKFRLPIDDPRCIEMFHVAGEFGLPVVLHLDVPFLPSEPKASYYAEWYGGTVENLERAIRACPETMFVGHAPGFWREISADTSSPEIYPSGPVQAPGKIQRLLDRYPNLHADLSAGSASRALKRDPDHARRFLENYSEKLLFGRDYYGGELALFLETLNLSQATQDRIYYLNAERLVSF